MRERFQRFMSGRYGVDELSRFLLGVTAILCILGIFLRSSILNGLVFLAIILIYFRMFSRNFSKRNQENERYMTYQNKVTGFFKKQKNLFEQRKIYHIYTCPSCKQKIRIQRAKERFRLPAPNATPVYQKELIFFKQKVPPESSPDGTFLS